MWRSIIQSITADDNKGIKFNMGNKTVSVSKLMPTYNKIIINNTTLTSDNHECSICLIQNNAEKRKLKNCDHIFHTTCILNWANSQFNQNLTCPICRVKITN